MKLQFTLIFLFFTSTLFAQEYWGLKHILQGSAEGYKPISAQADTIGGSANFSVTYSNACTETTSVSWNFSQGISKLFEGDTITVSLNPAETKDCFPNRAANIKVSLAGAGSSFVLKDQLSDAPIVNGLSGGVSGTNAIQGISTGEIIVGPPLAGDSVAQTCLQVRIDAQAGTIAMERKAHSIKHEIVYVFEAGYDPFQAVWGVNECAESQEKLADAEKEAAILTKDYNELIMMYNEFRDQTKVSLNLDIESDFEHDTISATLFYEKDWDKSWAIRLENPKNRNAAVTQLLDSAWQDMEVLSGMAFRWRRMEGVSKEVVMDRYFQIEEIHSRILNYFYKAIWQYYCGEVIPLMGRLEEIDNSLYSCGEVQYEELAERLESISLWSAWKANKEDYKAGCNN